MKNDIPMMTVEYPDLKSIEAQKRRILAAGMPKQKPFPGKLREIYWEPGIRVIFYHCGSACLITGMLYLLLIIGCTLPWQEERIPVCLSFLSCPMLYLIFSFLSLSSEEQDTVTELKQTLHCSFTRLVSLRMFYTGIGSMLLNLTILASLRAYPAERIWTIGAAGIGSMFLFATLSLYLYHKTGSCRYIGILILVWTALCVFMIRRGNMLYPLLFEQLPLAIHLAAAVCCMIGFTKYTGKVGNENAYTYTCQ